MAILFFSNELLMSHENKFCQNIYYLFIKKNVILITHATNATEPPYETRLEKSGNDVICVNESFVLTCDPNFDLDDLEPSQSQTPFLMTLTFT